MTHFEAAASAIGATLGFVGLGVMGGPMCANLASKRAERVLCYDVNPQTLSEAATSAEKADSLEALAAGTDIVFLCLPSGAAMESAINALLAVWTAQGRKGCTIVDMGTTSVALTRRLAGACEQQGQVYVDAPVARMPAAARDGTLSIMAGAKPDVLQRLLPYLRCMGTDITACGPTGSGQVVKILHNTILFETVHALAEALAIARSLGVDADVLLGALELGSADSRAVRVQGREALAPRAYPTGRFPARYALKDVSLALELGEMANVPVALAQQTAAILQQTCDMGLGDRYYPALYEVIAGEVKN
jgi:hypothetical protein